MRINPERVKAAQRRNRQNRLETLLIAAGIALVVLAVVGYFVVLPYTNVQEKACTVTDKDRATVTRVSDGNSTTESSMRVYTQECGVLQVKDMWFIGLFNAADLYSKIEVGKQYQFEISGYRVGLLSMFPNIREAVAL